MRFESFDVEHREYGQVTWYIVNKTENAMTLIGAPMLDRVKFYNPGAHEEARYIRTDFSSSRKTNDPGTLYEVQNAPSAEELDNENAQRYNDIVEYGSNQWVVSDLRQCLNGSFFDGFPKEFRDKILPQKHDIVLSRTSVNRYTQGKTSGQNTSDNTFVYDEYCGNYRLTRSVVEDYIYLPSFEERDILQSFITSCERFNQPMNFWLLDAAYETSVPYLVKCLAVAIDCDGKIRVNYGNNNARYPLHVCPMCTITTCTNVGKKENVETLHWTNIDEERVARAKKVTISSVDEKAQSAECVGSKGERYLTTLNSCQCGDYIRKRAVCKHMIRLAMELGLLNEYGRTSEDQRDFEIRETKKKLAYWYGCYYLLKEPVVSDAEYNALKEKAKSEYGISI